MHRLRRFHYTPFLRLLFLANFRLLGIVWFLVSCLTARLQEQVGHETHEAGEHHAVVGIHASGRVTLGVVHLAVGHEHAVSWVVGGLARGLYVGGCILGGLLVRIEGPVSLLPNTLLIFDRQDGRDVAYGGLITPTMPP